MCGRFTLTNPDPTVIAKTFNLDSVPVDVPGRYNVAPTQAVATVLNDADNLRHFAWMAWGLVPSWSKDAKGAGKLINARAETVAEKPSYRAALSKRRCLLIADGFYEWRLNADKTKTPMYIRLESGQPFGFAGLWERWTNPDSGEILTSCALITTTANDVVKPIHDRMPVILPPDAYADWLNYKQTDGQQITRLLTPYPADLMIAYPVSTLVNSPRTDDPAMIQPAE